jgi:plasminogen activator inhibitor 1 RNA-binding protein
MPVPSGVNNIFSLLDEDDNENDDGFTVVAKTAKPAAKPAKAEEAKTQPRERKSKTERPPRGEKGGDRRGPRVYDGEDKPTKPESEEGRKGGKGRDRGSKGGKKGGRREYDRHSGTGRGKGSSREGAGKFNWGEKTDGAQEQIADAADNENKAPADAPPVEVEEEEEDNSMSFDEYMKAKAGKKTVGGALNLRKIEESEGPTGVEYKRDGDGRDDAMAGIVFNDSYDGKVKNHDEKEEREGWVVADAILNMKFVDPNAGKGGDGRKGGKKGGRNDRSNDRGGRGKGQSRPHQGKIELSDTQAFPSLG